MNLIDVMGLGTVALRGICRLNVRFGWWIQRVDATH